MHPMCVHPCHTQCSGLGLLIVTNKQYNRYFTGVVNESLQGGHSAVSVLTLTGWDRRSH